MLRHPQVQILRLEVEILGSCTIGIVVNQNTESPERFEPRLHTNIIGQLSGGRIEIIAIAADHSPLSEASPEAPVNKGTGADLGCGANQRLKRLVIGNFARKVVIAEKHYTPCGDNTID